MILCLSQDGKVSCLTLLWRKGACLLTAPIKILWNRNKASSGVSQLYTVLKSKPDRSNRNAASVNLLNDLSYRHRVKDQDLPFKISKFTQKLSKIVKNCRFFAKNRLILRFSEFFLIGFGNGFDIELHDFFQTIFPNIC